jgi:gluconolactonase
MGYPAAFKVYDDAANAIFGAAPTLQLLHENSKYPFAHEAGVFIAEDNTLFITSNQFDDSTSGERKIQISKLCLPAGQDACVCHEIDAVDVPMANGGVNYNGGILFCAQGSLTTPGGLVWMDAKPPHACSMIVSSFYGRDFNSVNDVVVHSDGTIWFTDPVYGFEQGIRPKPKLPSQVYRYDPKTKSIRAMADGFGRPNGICFSPDEKIIYITDTDWIHGDGTTDDSRPSHMKAASCLSGKGHTWVLGY